MESNESNSEMNKSHHGSTKDRINSVKETNSLGNQVYNIEKIMEMARYKDGHILVNYIGYILSEPRKDVIKRAYVELGKDFLLSFLEKTMTIQNQGGIEKCDKTKEKIEKKAPGGVFFKLIKDTSCASKDVLKKIFVKNYKDRNERKKIMKKIENMLLI